MIAGLEYLIELILLVLLVCKMRFLLGRCSMWLLLFPRTLLWLLRIESSHCASPHSINVLCPSAFFFFNRALLNCVISPLKVFVRWWFNGSQVDKWTAKEFSSKA